MRKNVWIFNHYATNMIFECGGRHFWFAENLIKKGYKPRIFCASTIHNSDINLISGPDTYTEDSAKDIPFVFVKAPNYKGNGISRVRNMLAFFFGLFSVTKKIGHKYGSPDVIIGSSVHPFSCVAAIFIAKRYKIPCIVEIRDLWPEVLVEYGAVKQESLIARLLYFGEKLIYKKADAIIFTCEGGAQYIREQKWDKEIDISKVYYINNGVDLNDFDKNKIANIIEDDDLLDKDTFKVIYCGSIRMVNALDLYINCAKEILEQGHNNIKFYIYGSGDQKERLEKWCIDENINNVVFKGRVPKKGIPYIVSHANINLLEGKNMPLYRFGLSPNKLFEYFAAGRPIISTIKSGYDLIDRYNCGISMESNSPEEICHAILKIYSISPMEYQSYCDNARRAANDYDFKTLSNKLINVIESV